MPRGLVAIRGFADAFNAGDLDALVETLHPDVVIHSMRGPRQGIEAAREWATRKPGGLQQTMVIEDLIEGDGAAAGDGAVLALTRREWRWEGEEDKASEDEMAHLFELRDGLIAAWRPFEDRAAARVEAGL